ncbi:MAG: hypothetical protein WC784_01295 [Candidatus Shapirobacteria bacterium]|jgi:hypothetical protein
MSYQLKVFVDEVAVDEGFVVNKQDNVVELSGNEDSIKAKITGEAVEIETLENMAAILEREGKISVLPKKCRGKIIFGDKLWLLNERAKNDFLEGKREEIRGAAVEVIITEEKAVQKEIYVKEKNNFLEKNNRNINVILGAIVFLLLIGGTYFGYQKRSGDENLKKITEIKNNWQKEKTEIEGVRSMNIDTALEIAKKAEKEVENSGKIDKKYAQDLMNIKNEIEEIKKSLGGNNVSYEIAYDTSLTKDSSYEGMTVKEEVVYLWNQKLGNVNSVNVSLKSTEEIVSDNRIKNWQGIFNNGEKWWGYDQNKVYEIKRNELIETTIENGGGINGASGWNGIIYFWDNSQKMIEKMVNSSEQNWLKDGVNLEEEATGMAIDSNIWILGKSGKIYEYTRGQKVDYKMSFTPSVSSTKSLVTNDKVTFLAYIADEDTVLIYGKDGKILDKYVFDNQKLKALGIESQNNAVLVLSDNGKIYRVKIQ